MKRTWARSLAVVLALVLTCALPASAQRTLIGSLTWTAGAVAPTSTAEPAGSLYTRTDTAQIYVYDGSTWKTLAVNGAASGYKIARGVASTASASDTIVSGLTTVVAVVCTLQTDAADDPFLATCSIGDQAGTPAAGSFLLKTWKNTSGSDPTPLASSTTTNKVNWLAIGT